MSQTPRSARQITLHDGEIAIEYYDADVNILATNTGGKKPWRNNNPGNLIDGPGAIGRDSRGIAISKILKPA